MNWTGIIAIYLHEMDRMRRTTVQSIFSPVISSSLYFVVFGAAIGSRIPVIEDISYGSFIVPGMIMLALLTQSVSNASSGIFFPKFLGTINEIPSSLGTYNLKMNNNISLTYTYDSQGSSTGITALLQDIKSAGLKLKDLNSSQTSLETIFEKLLEDSA